MYANIVCAVRIGQYGIALVDGYLDDPQNDEREFPFIISIQNNDPPAKNRLYAGFLENGKMKHAGDYIFWSTLAQKTSYVYGSGMTNVDETTWKQVLEIFEEVHLG